MRSNITTLASALVLAIVLALAAPALADDGAFIELVNQTDRTVLYTYDKGDFWSSIIVDGEIASGSSRQWEKSDTKHEAKAIGAYWTFKVAGHCGFKLGSNKDGSCELRSVYGNCGDVESLGDCRFRYVIKTQ